MPLYIDITMRTKGWSKHSKFLGFGLILFLLGITVGASFSQTPQYIVSDFGFVKTASYIVTKSGSTYYAVDGTYGTELASGSDASTVIQDALAALTGGRTWKEKIVLMGDITLDAKITVDSYTIIQIIGKVTLADGVNDEVFYATSESNIEIFGGTIDGNRVGQTSDSRGIYFAGVTDFYVKVRVTSTYSHAVHFSQCNNGIVHLTADDIGKSGLGITNSSFIHATVQILDSGTQTTASAVKFDGGHDITLEGSGRSSTGHGISFDTSFDDLYNIDVLGFKSNQNGNCGARVTGESPNNALDIHFIGGEYNENEETGISIYNANSSLIQAVTAKNNGQAVSPSTPYGIHLAGIIGCFYVKVDNNHIYDDQVSPTQTYGVSEYANSDYNTITNNHFRDNINSAVSISGANTKVKFNQGFATENVGTATISSSTTVTFDHGLAGTPDHFEPGWQDLGYGDWKWSATSTQVTVTVTNSGTYNLSWSAIYEP